MTYNLGAAFGEAAGLGTFLKPNTTYYARVKVVSGSGGAYNATLASTSTFAAAPDAPTFVNPSSYTVTANWTASQDGPVLKYQAVIAANPNFAPALATTTWQAGQSATFAAGINPNTQYYVGVRALGNNGDVTALSVAGSTTTQYGPPGVPFFTAVSPVVIATDSLVMQWTSGGNGGSPQYRADISSDPSGNFGYYFSSATYNLGAAFGEAAGLGTFLKPNTTYYARVRVASGSGSAYNATVTSTSTFAAAPEAPTFVNPSSYTVTANWTASQDGPALKYQAVISLNPDLSSPLATTAWQAGQSYIFGAGINPNTQYYVGVRASGNNGDVTAFTAAASTVTQLSPPGIAGQTFPAVSPVYADTDSLRVAWTDGGNNSPTLRYEVYVSSYSDYRSFFSSQTYNTSATFGEAGGFPSALYLKPNTIYYAHVRIANDGSGRSSPFTSLGSTSTFAAAPTGLAITSVSSYSVTAQWSDSLNGPIVSYRAELATDALFTQNVKIAAASGPSATFIGLNPVTQYYVQVQAVGNRGDLTAFTPYVSTYTLSASPSGLAGAVLGTSSITWTWDAVINASSYNFYPSSGGPAINLNAAALTQTGLSTNTQYGGQVSVLGPSGESPKSALVSKYTFAVMPSSLAVVFSDTWLTSATIRASWDPGSNPVPTTFELQASTDPTTAFSPVAAYTLAQSSGADLTVLSFGATYYLRVEALNGDGIATAFAVGASTYVAPPPQLVMSFTPGQPSSGTFYQAAGPVTIYIPSGAFTVPVTITIKTPTSTPCANGPAAAQGLDSMGIMAQFDIAQGIEPLMNVFLSMGYGGGAGLPAGTDPATLVLARCDETRNEWVPLYSTSSANGQTIYAMTPHLSIFQVMAQTPATNISAVMVSNNPFRPSRGQMTMDFKNAPAGTRLRIYTARGELVKDLTTNVSGMASWDGTNRSGRGVASGVYFVLIQGAGQKKTITVAVER